MLNPKTLLLSGDFNLFNQGYSGGGVYLASGLYISKSFSSPIYIGSSNNLEHRLTNQHIPHLSKGTHDNNVFQNAWKSHSGDFVWFLLEETVSETQFLREQWYLDTYRPFVDEGNGYNIAKNVFCPTLGLAMSEETKEKISLSKIGRSFPNLSGINNGMFGLAGEYNPSWGRKASEEEKMKMSLGKKGKYLGENSHLYGIPKTDEHKQKLRDSRKGKYGKENHPMWGKEHSEETKLKISLSKIGKKMPEETRKKKSEQMKGTGNHFFGQSHTEEVRSKISTSRSKSFKIRNPSGDLVEGKNLKKFSMENNLNECCLHFVLKGKQKSHRGWTRFEESV